MLDRVARTKRRSKSKARVIYQGQRQPRPSQPPGPTKRASGSSALEVLDQIEDARAAQQEAEAEIAALVDHAVTLGIGWPEIATRLGVTRQAARQHYQRRHRDSAIR